MRSCFIWVQRTCPIPFSRQVRSRWQSARNVRPIITVIFLFYSFFKPTDNCFFPHTALLYPPTFTPYPPICQVDVSLRKRKRNGPVSLTGCMCIRAAVYFPARASPSAESELQRVLFRITALRSPQLPNNILTISSYFRELTC